jgi:hypothetical protein
VHHIFISPFSSFLNRHWPFFFPKQQTLAFISAEENPKVGGSKMLNWVKAKY